NVAGVRAAARPRALAGRLCGRARARLPDHHSDSGRSRRRGHERRRHDDRARPGRTGARRAVRPESRTNLKGDPMRVNFRLVAVLAAAGALLAALATTAAATPRANVCPGGQVRFGVEPYDSGPKFTGAYQALTKALQTNLHCPVKLI